MSFLGRIAKLDSAMQRGLDNGMALVFGGRVVPAEIEELLKQEASDNAVRTYDGELECPNLFTLSVSEKDFSNLAENHGDLPATLAGQLSRYFRNSEWSTQGPVCVQVKADKDLHTGQLKVSSSSTNQEYRSGFAGQKPRVNLLLQDGSSRTYSVHEGSNIIGRSADADLQLPDTGVSRSHAEITWDGYDAVLVDMESTNGTVVNNQPIENWMLADGDVIQVGHSLIEVRITGA
ncbi:DUF3662 and FHA domain-containing protein [uncultured Corynebacterium sp.]|uniref:DUF3662 and FHA domain-containing protein n=1 Tax=uncultured Corynebacterium sp. TaxID=159447 RepID=UPI002608A167|nr:DUF3662 and FHA domain-containing protein [uncultured Corynebacterium sp.]